MLWRRTSVTVLIPLFPFPLTAHPTVAASAESFDNCQSSSPNYGPGANNLRVPPSPAVVILTIFQREDKLPSVQNGSFLFVKLQRQTIRV